MRSPSKIWPHREPKKRWKTLDSGTGAGVAAAGAGAGDAGAGEACSSEKRSWIRCLPPWRQVWRPGLGWREPHRVRGGGRAEATASDEGSARPAASSSAQNDRQDM